MCSSRCTPRTGPKLAAFVSASGSAGTLGAGDWLKEKLGTKIVAVEALECPTMLYNGFGEHNIQGIGDKHIPFIHNVTNTDVAVAVSDHATDQLYLLFNDPAGWPCCARRACPKTCSRRCRTGLSSICNMLAAIKTAKALGLGASDALITVATDGAAMYTPEAPKAAIKALRRPLRRAQADQAAQAWPAPPRNMCCRWARREQPHLQPGLLTWGAARRGTARLRPAATRPSGAACTSCCRPGTR